jgi:hypothetical protein
MKKSYRTPKHVLNYLNGHNSARVNPFRSKLAAKEDKHSDKKLSPHALSDSAGDILPAHSLDCPDPGEFPIDAFPTTVRGLSLHLATRSPLALCMIVMGTLTVVAAAIGRKFATSLSCQEELTLCNLFTLFGVKTTKGKNVLRTPLKGLIEMQRQLQEQQEKLASQLTVKIDVAKIKYKRIKAMIADHSAEGADTSDAEKEAEGLLSDIKNLTRRKNFSYTLCLRHPTGAAMRKVFAKGDRSVFLFSLDGGSILEDAFSRRDKLLTRFILSGFSGEETGSETGTCGSFGGEALVSFQFAVQPHILYPLLFNRKAAEAGLLNRPIVINAEFLDPEPVSKEVINETDAKQAWNSLIENLVKFRFSKEPPIIVPWCQEAETLFAEFDTETNDHLATWPEEASQHSGRVKELAVRIAGIFLAVEVIESGTKPDDTCLQLDVAERAIHVMGWLFRHRLRIQKDAYRRHLASLANDLEAKLKKVDGVLRVSRIKDSHPQIYRELNAILEAFPERFHRGEERKGKTGPIAETVVLKKYIP